MIPMPTECKMTSPQSMGGAESVQGYFGFFVEELKKSPGDSGICDLLQPHKSG